MKQNSGEKSSTASTIVYWAIYLPILALAVISVPFEYQKKQVEQHQLENAKQRALLEIEAMGKEIDNMNVRLQYFTGESIKLHAEALGLHKPSPGQFVVLNAQGAPVYAGNRPRRSFPETAIASQKEKKLITTPTVGNTADPSAHSANSTIH